jgi:tetratricopeptide (TPR) repeat protein
LSVQLSGYRVFLSSPTGLESERAAFFEMVSEVNEIEGEARSRIFIPHGWEREPRGSIPPQGRANERLRECDYLILLLADRWGSPTGPDGTGFSSGTEEEYVVATECLESDDYPMRDIVVLFKGISEQQLGDPGEQLRKVLAFKAALEKKKSLFFGTFDNQSDLDSIFRQHLHRWLRDEDSGHPKKKRGSVAPPAFPLEETTEETTAPKENGIAEILAEAKRLAAAGSTSKAEARFAEAVKEDPEDLEVRFAHAQFLRRTNRLTHAIDVSKALIDKAQARGEDEWAIRGLSNLGVSRRKLGFPKESIAALRRAVEMAEKSDSYRQHLAYAENNLGLAIRHSGNTGQAEKHYLRALQLYEELGDEDGLSHAHSNLCYVMRERGEFDQAREHAKAVFALGGSSPGCVAMAHCNLGLIAEEEEDMKEAERRFESARQLNVETKNSAGEAMTYAHLARVKLEMGDEHGALIDGRKAIKLNDWSSNADGLAMSLHVVGRVEMAQHEWGLAESQLSDARDIYRTLDYPIGIAGTSVDLATLFARMRRIDEAKEALAQARHWADGIEHVALQARILRAEEEVQSAPTAELPAPAQAAAP